MSYRVALVKLLPKEFVEDFLNGSLYLNTCAYFSQLDQTDTVRADPNDGVFEARQVVEIAILDESGSWLPIPGVQNPVIFRSDELLKLNILCLYTITDRPNDTFDERNVAFGSVAVFISNLPEFIRRVRTAAALLNWAVAHGPVQYVEPTTHDGPMGPFRKFGSYAYQGEFRFVFSTGKREACRLEVGSLRDIIQVRLSTEVAGIWSAMRVANA